MEYRPIYVTGDVLTPGQQVYRASMTVRQAVAVAGGFSLLRSRAQQPGTDPVDLVRDYQSLSTEYIREYFHVARVNAELKGEDNFEASLPREISLPASSIDPILQAEVQSLKTAQADHRKERSFLEDAVKQSDAQLVTLKKQQDGEEKGVQADEEELERVVRAIRFGIIAQPSGHGKPTFPLAVVDAASADHRRGYAAATSARGVHAADRADRQSANHHLAARAAGLKRPVGGFAGENAGAEPEIAAAWWRRSRTDWDKRSPARGHHRPEGWATLEQDRRIG